MKKLLISIFSVYAVVSISNFAVADDDDDDRKRFNGYTFSTPVNTAQHVPDHMTGASGFFNIKFDRGLTRADFVYTVSNVVGLTVAHLHCAPAGANGPVVVTLFYMGPVDIDKGLLAAGTITNNDISDPGTCGMPINNVASLYAAIRAGIIYAHAHTLANPAGEIRGQLYDR